MSTDPQPQPAKRTRRAEPINTHTAKTGTVTYWFQLDVGTKPDGSRDRRKFTYRTKTEARKELRRISSEVAAGTYNRPTSITVDEACDAWLAGRRGIRKVTYQGYVDQLKPVRRYLGSKKLQALTKADGDALVEWMLTAGRTSPRHYRADSLAGRVVALVAEHPDGITAAELAAAIPGADVHTSLSGLIRSGRVTRPRRGVYVLAEPAASAGAEVQGVKPVTVRATLTAFGAVVQSYTDQGVLPRNVIALVERPRDVYDDSDSRTVVAWSPAEVETFRVSVAGHRLYALWLVSMYGLRRSEVLGLRWSDVDLDTGTLRVRRGPSGGGKRGRGGPHQGTETIRPHAADARRTDRGAADLQDRPQAGGAGRRCAVGRPRPGGCAGGWRSDRAGLVLGRVRPAAGRDRSAEDHAQGPARVVGVGNALARRPVACLGRVARPLRGGGTSSLRARSGGRSAACRRGTVRRLTVGNLVPPAERLATWWQLGPRSGRYPERTKPAPMLVGAGFCVSG